MRWSFRRAAPPSSQRGENLSQRENDELMETSRCPDCGGFLRKGPEGGVSINIACIGCGSEFNFSPLLTQRNSTKGDPNHTRLWEVFGIKLKQEDSS